MRRQQEASQNVDEKLQKLSEAMARVWKARRDAAVKEAVKSNTAFTGFNICAWHVPDDHRAYLGKTVDAAAESLGLSEYTISGYKQLPNRVFSSWVVNFNLKNPYGAREQQQQQQQTVSE